MSNDITSTIIRKMSLTKLRALAKFWGVKYKNQRRPKQFLILLCLEMCKAKRIEEKRQRQYAREEKRLLKPPKEWYALVIRPRQERGVRKRIRKEAKKEGLTPWIGKMVIPVDYNLKLQKWKGSQRRIIAKDKRLPGYLLCKLSLTDNVISLVKCTRGVLGFLPFTSKPVPIDDEEVARICQAKEGDPVKGKFAKLKASEIQVGHFVKVLKLSPFMDMEGTVKKVIEGKEGPILIVEVKILDRPTEVKLEWWNVKRIPELTPEE